MENLLKQEFLKEIEKAKSKNLIFVVEGFKDKISLKQLGLSKIFILHGKPFYKFIEELIYNIRKKDSAVCILTDLDKKGKNYYNKIRRELIREGIKIDDSLRKFLFKRRISHIEGFSSFLEKN